MMFCQSHTNTAPTARTAVAMASKIVLKNAPTTAAAALTLSNAAVTTFPNVSRTDAPNVVTDVTVSVNHCLSRSNSPDATDATPENAPLTDSHAAVTALRNPSFVFHR